MKENKLNLAGLTYNEIKKLLNILEEKDFHAKQIIEQIHKKKKEKIDDIKCISKKTKDKLKEISIIKTLKIKDEKIAKDNTIKWLIEIDEKNFIETVAIPNKKQHFTLCVSSQIGCISNCKFCYTAKQGFSRNLKSEEIISQLFEAEKRIDLLFKKKNKITNIVMMGMGEPLLNSDNVLSFIELASNQYAYNISKKKITISTCGIIPEIKKIKKYKIPLAISLHAPSSKLRSSIMPINKKYDLKDLLDTCKEYNPKKKITFEYILLKGINESINHANELIKILKGIKCKICLIPFNNFPGTNYEIPNYETIIKFKNTLKNSGMIVNIREKKGDEINAACGQLSGIVQDKTKRNKKFIEQIKTK